MTDDASPSVLFGNGTDWHVVDDFGDSGVGEEARHQHVAVRPVELLASGSRRRLGEMTNRPPLWSSRMRGEHARRVEVREAQPVDRSGRPDQSSGPHVADDAVALDRLVGHGSGLVVRHALARRRDVRTMSTMSGTVSVRAQSRCSSHASETQLIGCAPGLDDALEPGSVRFGRRSAHGVDHREDLVAFTQRIEGRERQTDLGPERGHDELLAARRFHGPTELDVFPGVDLGSVDLRACRGAPP